MSSFSQQQATRGKWEIGVDGEETADVKQSPMCSQRPIYANNKPIVGSCCRQSDSATQMNMSVANVALGASMNTPCTPRTSGPAHVGFEQQVDALLVNQVMQKQFMVMLRSMGVQFAQDSVCGELQVAQDDGDERVDVKKSQVALGEAIESDSSPSQVVNDALAQFQLPEPQLTLQQPVVDDQSDYLSDVSAVLNPYERQELEYLRMRIQEIELGQNVSGTQPMQQGEMQSGLEALRVSGFSQPQQLYGGVCNVQPQTSGLGPVQREQQGSNVHLSQGDYQPQQMGSYVPPICVLSMFGPLRIQKGRVEKFNKANMWVWLSQDELNTLGGDVLQQLSQVQLLGESQAALQKQDEQQQQFGDLLDLGFEQQQHVEQPYQSVQQVPQPLVTAQQYQVPRAVGESSSQQPTLVPREVKIERPPTFSGKHGELQNWLFVMKQYLDTVSLGDGPAACRLVVTYLRGDALTWWRAYANDGVKVFEQLTLDVLFDELSLQFTDLDRELKLRDSLLGLRQTGSVQAYTTLFKKLQLELGAAKLADGIALHCFVQGLKPFTRQQVHMQRPDTLQEAVLLAERFDQSLYWLKGKGGARDANFRGNVSHSRASMYSGAKTSGPSPMVLGSMQNNARGGMASRGGPRGGARSGAHAGGRSNVGAAVKCYFCGRAGHVKKDCFKLKNSQTGGAGPAQHAKN